MGTISQLTSSLYLPMEVGHILLGRPWPFDRKIIYNGLTNEITLTHLGTKFVLHPQTPSQGTKDQLTMKDKRDEKEKLENQKKKKDSKALSSKAKGKEKEEKDSSKKIILQQKVILKEHSFINNLSTFSYQGKYPLAPPYLLSLRLFLK